MELKISKWLNKKVVLIGISYGIAGMKIPIKSDDVRHDFTETVKFIKKSGGKRYSITTENGDILRLTRSDLDVLYNLYFS